MPDIRLIELIRPVPYNVTFDWMLDADGGLNEDNELAAAVIVALGTDALADVDDDLPGLPPDDDRRGWWADLDAELIWGGWPIGSKIWLLERGKINDIGARQGATVGLAEMYTREALKPFLDNKIVSQIDVHAERGTPDKNAGGYSSIVVAVTLWRGPRPAVSLRFDSLWDQMR